MEQLVETKAQDNKLEEAKVIRSPREREMQRTSARMIRFLRGKVKTGSTALVSIEDNNRVITDLMSKFETEQAIIKNNEEKYNQSFHTPFFNFPPLCPSLASKTLPPLHSKCLSEFSNLIRKLTHMHLSLYTN